MSKPSLVRNYIVECKSIECLCIMSGLNLMLHFDMELFNLKGIAVVVTHFAEMHYAFYIPIWSLFKYTVFWITFTQLLNSENTGHRLYGSGQWHIYVYSKYKVKNEIILNISGI